MNANDSDAGYDSHSEDRKQYKEYYNHQLLISEDEYVNVLEAIVDNVVVPLRKHADRCKIKRENVDYVFYFIEQMKNFHLQLLTVMREKISIVEDFLLYINFLSMYNDYLEKYDKILNCFSTWTSMEFREFVQLRLQDEKIQKHINDRLCSFPWYLYRPFDRVKEYHRFFKDLKHVSKKDDEDFEMIQKCYEHIVPICKKIKMNEEKFQEKTKLLEIQLQVHGNPRPIVHDGRYLIYSRACQMKCQFFGKKHKLITTYLFNDLFLWASTRGKFKGSYSFYDDSLEIEIPQNSKPGDSIFYIGRKSETHKKFFQCADDCQRDNLMAKIKNAYDRCMQHIKNMPQQQVKSVQQMSQYETHIASELSRSSMVDSSSFVGGLVTIGNGGDSFSQEHSISLTSDFDLIHKQQSQQHLTNFLQHISKRKSVEEELKPDASVKQKQQKSSNGQSSIISSSPTTTIRNFGNNPMRLGLEDNIQVNGTTSIPLKHGGPIISPNGTHVNGTDSNNMSFSGIIPFKQMNDFNVTNNANSDCNNDNFTIFVNDNNVYGNNKNKTQDKQSLQKSKIYFYNKEKKIKTNNSNDNNDNNDNNSITNDDETMTAKTVTSQTTTISSSKRHVNKYGNKKQLSFYS